MKTILTLIRLKLRKSSVLPLGRWQNTNKYSKQQQESTSKMKQYLTKKAISLLSITMMCLSPLMAQITKFDAINAITNLINNRIDRVNVYMEPAIQTSDYYVISPHDSIAVAFDDYWMFFIDEEPQYLWGHRCTYIFIDKDNGLYISVEKQLPPFQYGLSLENVSIAYDDEMPISDQLGGSIHVPFPDADVNDGKYAVLFCGGDGTDLTIMWNALSHSYCSLIEHGYMKENIFVISCDGDVGFSTNPRLDLDNDSIPDILPIVCNRANLDSVFYCLSQTVTESDILYVFASTHGNNNTNPLSNDVSFVLWENELLDDDHFASMLERISCSQMIINLYSCYAGGFVQELLDMNNESKKTIITCIDGFSPYLRHHTQLLKMDVYNYLTCSVLRGGYPELEEPWHSPYGIGDNPTFGTLFGDESNYDLSRNGGNDNGLQEINETINFVSEYDAQFNNKGFKIYDCGFNNDLLSLRGITGRITTTDTIHHSFHIEEELSVEQNADLYLQSNTKLYLYDADFHIKELSELHVSDSVSIVARSGTCRVIVEGSWEMLGKGIRFAAEEGAELEIIINSGSISFGDVVFDNCKLTLQVNDIAFTNCKFSDTPIDHRASNRGASSILISNCVFMANDGPMECAISINGVGTYDINNCVINGNGVGESPIHNGIKIYYCGGRPTTLFKNRVYGNTISNCSETGLLMYASTGNVTMNKISGNQIGVKFLNNCNINNFSGNCEASLPQSTQFIHDNASYEVYMTSSCNPQSFKYNVIYDTTQAHLPYVYYDGLVDFVLPGQSDRELIDISNNYWGTNPNPEISFGSNTTATSYSYLPLWNFGDCPWFTPDTASIIKSIADSFAETGNYNAAKQLYMQVAEEYPTTISAENSLKALLPLEQITGNDYEDLREYYINSNATSTDSTISALTSSLANKCNEILGNYVGAIEWYEDVIKNPASSFNDSIFATIDLGNLYLTTEANSIKGVQGNMLNYIPKTYQEYQQKTNHALSLLPKTKEKRNLQNPIEFNPVTHLDVTRMEDNSVLISWDYPEGFAPNGEVTLSWSGDYEIPSAAGQSHGDIAHRFEVADLTRYIGWKLKCVSVVPLSASHTYFVRVWKGTEMDSLTLVFEKMLQDPSYNTKNYVSIDSVITIETGKEFWFGAHTDPNGLTFDYAWATDSGPAMPGKGDLYRLENGDQSVWDSISHYQVGSLYGSNFCIEAILENPEGKMFKLGYDNNTFEVEELLGYNVYANLQQIATIQNRDSLSFIDRQFMRDEVDYCVEAIYSSANSALVCLSIEVSSTDDNVNNSEESFSIVFPNPGHGSFNIRTPSQKARVEIYDAQGKMIYERNITKGNTKIPTEQWVSGMYFWRVYNDSDEVESGKWIKQ